MNLKNFCRIYIYKNSKKTACKKKYQINNIKDIITDFYQLKFGK